MIIHPPIDDLGTLDPRRKGLPTASSASKLITSKGEASTQITGYARDLAHAVLGVEKIGGEFKGNDYTRAGHEMEPNAASWYTFMTETAVTRASFCTDDDMTCGCTPDYFVSDGKGLLQLKYRNAQHLIYMDKIQNADAVPKDDLPQLAFELMVCDDRDYNDIAYYHDKLDPFICRVYRSDVAEIIVKLKKRVAKCIELRDKFLENAATGAEKLNDIYFGRRAG